MIKRLRITINGEPYEVTAEVFDDAGGSAQAPQSASLSTVTPPVMSPAPRPLAASGTGLVTSPMSGRLVSYSVKAGDDVAVGDELAIVEAMKMNTYVHAESGGKVLELLATPGDGVEEGQSLLRIG